MKPVYRVDPRVKLALFLVACVFVMNCTQVLFCMLFGGFITLLLLLNGEWIAGISSFTLYTLMVFGFGYVRKYIHGPFSMLVFGVMGLMRIMLPIFMSFRLVVKTTTVSEFMSAFQRMRLSSKFIIPFAVMFRFVPTVKETWYHIRNAMAFRGISLSPFGILKNPVKALEYILLPLLFSATGVMDELAAASLARGLDSDQKRSSLKKVEMRIPDYLFILIVTGFFVLMFLC